MRARLVPVMGYTGVVSDGLVGFGYNASFFSGKMPWKGTLQGLSPSAASFGQTGDMDRREFLLASAGAALSLRIPSGEQKPKMTKQKYWCWTGVNDKATSAQLKRKYHALKAHGLTGVFLGDGISESEFDAIKEAGLELHTWMWTTNRGDEWIRKNHPDWYQVSRTGKSCFDHPPYVDYYRWISPVIPGVQAYLREKVAELASHKAVDGVHLDYVRYPDIILPRGLWSKYKLDQTEEMPEYDFCYSEHTRNAFKAFCGRDPMDIKDPSSDQQWLHFRYDSVTHLVKQLADEAHKHKKAITAAVFPTPRLARKICRQDWDKWPLDAACPMIYHSFYLEPVAWVGDMVLENVQAVKFPIYAGLYMPAFNSDDEFRQALRLVHKRGGAGVSLFGDVSPARWKVFESERV